MFKGFMIVLCVLILTPLVASGQTYIGGHKADTLYVFNDVAIVSTASDTSSWLLIADAQYFTVVCAADSIGGAGAVDVDIKYELSLDGSTVAWAVGDAAAKTLISGFTGYDYSHYYQALQCPIMLWIRFIVTGTASNSALTKLKMWLVKQP